MYTGCLFNGIARKPLPIVMVRIIEAWIMHILIGSHSDFILFHVEIVL